jgi:hypothetical protein
MHRLLGIAAFLLFLVCSTAAQSNVPPGSHPDQYSATAFVTGIFAPTSVTNTIAFDFFVYTYTPDDELQSLVSIFNAQGEAGLEKTFSNMKERGRVSTNLRPSQGSFKFARSTTSGNETVIRMATDRILSFPELTGDTALSKYRFSVVELHLDAQGKGEGTLTYAAKLKFNPQGELEVESYTAAPIPLRNVRKVK